MSLDFAKMRKRGIIWFLIGVAVYIAIRSAAEQAFWLNVAVCSWISANAYWMVCEFMGRDEYRNFAGIGIALGLICVAVFYLKPGRSAVPLSA